MLVNDWVKLSIQLLLATSSLYSAWVNLVNKKISYNGFDALTLVLFSKKKAMMIRNSPQLVKRMGILMLLIGIGSLLEIISIFTKNTGYLLHQ